MPSSSGAQLRGHPWTAPRRRLEARRYSCLAVPGRFIAVLAARASRQHVGTVFAPSLVPSNLSDMRLSSQRPGPLKGGQMPRKRKQPSVPPTPDTAELCRRAAAAVQDAQKIRIHLQSTIRLCAARREIRRWREGFQVASVAVDRPALDRHAACTTPFDGHAQLF